MVNTPRKLEIDQNFLRIIKALMKNSQLTSNYWKLSLYDQEQDKNATLTIAIQQFTRNSSQSN